MSDQAVLYVLKRHGSQIAAKGFSPHDMRRMFIGDLLNAGAYPGRAEAPRARERLDHVEVRQARGEGKEESGLAAAHSVPGRETWGRGSVSNRGDGPCAGVDAWGCLRCGATASLERVLADEEGMERIARKGRNRCKVVGVRGTAVVAVI